MRKIIASITVCLSLLAGITVANLFPAFTQSASASSPYGCWTHYFYSENDKVCFQIAGSGYCVYFMQGEIDPQGPQSQSWSEEVHGPSGWWSASYRSGTVGGYGKATWLWTVNANMIAGPYYVQYTIDGVSWNTPSYNVQAGNLC